MSEGDLLQALRDCYHPILRRNIVELGLIRSAKLETDPGAPGAGIHGVPPRYIARVSITAPGSDEAANAQFSAQIANRLAGLQAISRTEIELLPPLFAIL